MKEYINDLKFVLVFLFIVAATIVWNLDYLFSEQTLSEVKVVEKKVSNEWSSRGTYKF